jgi:hypothetical protein
MFVDWGIPLPMPPTLAVDIPLPIPPTFAPLPMPPMFEDCGMPLPMPMFALAFAPILDACGMPLPPYICAKAGVATPIRHKTTIAVVSRVTILLNPTIVFSPEL